MGDTDLQNKVLAISEEAEAQRASYPLKLLQSEVSIASTGKDVVSGKHVTHTHRVKGPVMLFLTTTAVSIDEELLNRCIVLTVDEDREQTRAIHQVQREAQVEHVMMLCDIADPIGLRDRAILETIYSTGMRRLEMIRLKLYDLQLDRSLLLVNQGKGSKDRYVPVGARAIAWLRKSTKPVHSSPSNPTT